MKKTIKWIGASLLILIVIAITLVYFYGPTMGARYGMPIYLFTPSVERYGKIAIEIMDSNGYYANKKEWEEQKEKALNEMKTLSSFKEIHPIISESLKIAGGKHSFLISSGDFQDKKAEDTMPVVERVEDILIIKLPSILDAQSNGRGYAEIVLQFLQQNKDAKGVVVDLQNNTGGDMGPMVTSVAPLLPDGKILFFVDSKKSGPCC